MPKRAKKFWDDKSTRKAFQRGWNAAIVAAKAVAIRQCSKWQRIVNSKNSTPIGAACAARGVDASEAITTEVAAMKISEKN